MANHVLLVDDEPNFLNSMVRSLRREDFILYTANSGQDALALLQENRIDVIVTDEMMPGMHGSDLISIVREQYPDIMCILLTGFASLDAALKAINNGEVYRFLTKPCEVADLAMTITTALQQKHLIAESRQLVKEIQDKDNFIKSLEKKHPGITDVKRDEDGAIIID